MNILKNEIKISLISSGKLHLFSEKASIPNFTVAYGANMEALHKIFKWDFLLVWILMLA